jgi:hypothetical protein
MGWPVRVSHTRTVPSSLADARYWSLTAVYRVLQRIRPIVAHLQIVEVEEDVVREFGHLVHQPLLEGLGFPVIAAGMTEEDPMHHLTPR